jgi:putative PEP-CTERM system histidine kinase
MDPATSLATVAYGLAAVGYAVFALQLMLGWKAGRQRRLLFAAVLVTALWAACGAMVGAFPLIGAALGVLDALRVAAWLLLLSVLIRGSAPSQAPTPSSPLLQLWILVLALALTLAPLLAATQDVPSRVALLAGLAAAITGMALVEQLYRATTEAYRWSIKLLCIGLATGFAFDLYVFAEAVMFRQLPAATAQLRGAIALIVLPLLMVTVVRTPALAFHVSVSRRVVFHTTALAGSGLYLLAVAAAGYYLRLFGGSWGEAIAVVVVIAAAVAFMVVAFSGSARARLKVAISKNFFSYRYDYREEWLRFTRALSGAADDREMKHSIVMALADLVESPGGVLLLRADAQHFSLGRLANVRMQDTSALESIPEDDAVATFLLEKRWIVRVDECRARPETHDGLRLPRWLSDIPGAWLVIPLFYRESLAAMVVLQQPRAPIDLNWEVLDLLKTAARQAAAFLGYAQTAEALMEARKFESFNKMSAFVVHDLKNLVAQLNLLSRNAQRHMDNPEFRQDMLMTIDHVAGRMNHLMMQLREDTRPIDRPARVDVGPILERIRRLRPATGTELTLEMREALAVMAHADRLERVVGHLVQNAVEATPEHGKVSVSLWRDGGQALIQVQDTGQGMTEEFIRERLFKPFQSTKAGGMGIGTFESAQYIRELGGSIEVSSRPGAGTTFRVRLPLASDTALAAQL